MSSAGQVSPRKYTWRNDLRRLPGDAWKTLRGKPETAAALLLVLFAGVSLHSLAIHTDTCVESISDGHWPALSVAVLTLIWFVLALASAAAVWEFRHVFREIHVRSHIESAMGPRPYLVLFVSKQSLVTDAAMVPENGPVSIPAKDPKITLQRTDLGVDASLIAEKLGMWNWEMLFRGIEPHLPKLKRVFLVGSADSRGISGSYQTLEAARKLIAPYLKPKTATPTIDSAGPVIELWKSPVDFEDFENVHATLESIRGSIADSMGKDEEICVDMTGGQKPTSAAAGAFTMNKDVVLQYVRTNPPKDARIYDVQLLQVPDSGH